MVVYTLNLGVVPVRRAYSRDKNELSDLLEEVKQSRLFGIELSTYIPEMWGREEDIKEERIATIPIIISSGAMIGFTDLSKPIIPLIPGFQAEMYYETIINYEKYRSGLEKHMMGQFCMIPMHNGSGPMIDFVPEEVYEAMKRTSVRHLESISWKIISDTAKGTKDGVIYAYGKI